MTQNKKIRWLYKPTIWLLCLLPIAYLFALIAENSLPTNPTEFTNQYLGIWAIRFLWITLSLTPLALITGWKNVIRFRRLVGLFAFFYVTLHVSSYVALDQNFNWFAIYNDILKRVFITVGFAASIILTILAATSPKFIIKRLGGRFWKGLHQGVYLASILVVIHFVMMRKGLQIEPLIYTGFLVALLGIRVGVYLKNKVFTRTAT